LVIRLQHFHASLFDIRQSDSNVATGKCLVHRAIRQLEGVRGAIMAIDALHIVFRQSFSGIRRGIGTGESFDFPGFCVSIFDPRDRLPCRARHRETDVNARAEVSSVNSPDLVPSYPHHEDGLRAGVCFISAYLLITRRVTPANFCGQWQFSQVALAGTRRLLSRAEGIGLG
jgi:hypothetical protein